MHLIRSGPAGEFRVLIVNGEAQHGPLFLYNPLVSNAIERC
jgi:hypothetical protein